MVLENQAKIQKLDSKGYNVNANVTFNGSGNNGVPTAKQEAPLPALPEVDIEKYYGMEQPVLERFLDVSLLEKDVTESK